MYTFYVVIRHNDSEDFSSIHYKTDNEILTEIDLRKIEDNYLNTRTKFRMPTIQIISWQRINVQCEKDFS